MSGLGAISVAGLQGGHQTGPLPYPRGEPEHGEMWAPGGGKPFGLEFLGCQATTVGFMLPCPHCCGGWVRVVPDGTWFGYRLAYEDGCCGDLGHPCWPDNRCAAEDIAWWHLLRLGDVPPPPPSDERDAAYAAACIRRILTDLPEQPSSDELCHSAYSCGRWLQAGGLDDILVLNALVAASARAAQDGDTAACKLSVNLAAGRAQPGMVPR